MKVFEDDIIYNQRDKSEEVLFILQGRVKLQVDINIRMVGNPIFVSFNQYVEGSYFGDSDVFTKKDRDSTAIASLPTTLLVLTKRDLKRMIKSDETVETEMLNIALERREYHMRKICFSICNNSEYFSLLKESVKTSIIGKMT